MDKNKKRILYFDVLNVISCFSVVCLHTNSYVHSFSKDNWWWLRVFVEVVCYFAVPVFFMLSGATLMGYRKRYSTADFIRKRFLRAFFPYLCWGVIFSLLSIYSLGLSNVDIKEMLLRFTTGNIPYTNYWFFIPLFLLYFYIPFLSIMIVKLNYKQFIYLIIVMFFFQSFLPTIYEVLDLDYSFFQYHQQQQLPIAGYFIYALLGYFIVSFDVEKNNRLCRWIYALAIVSLVCRYILVYQSDTREPALFTYFGLYAFFPAIALFLLCKRLSIKNLRVANGFNYLAKRSYGVYLIHTFVINLLSHEIEMKSPVMIFLAILVYVISILIVSLMQKFKLTKYLVP